VSGAVVRAGLIEVLADLLPARRGAGRVALVGRVVRPVCAFPRGVSLDP